MKISKKEILDSFNYCLKFYSKDQKKVDIGKNMIIEEGFYTAKNLKNFRNNSLSQGLDDNYKKSNIKSLYKKLSIKEKNFY